MSNKGNNDEELIDFGVDSVDLSKKSTTNVKSNVQKDMLLYIIVDKTIYGMASYFRHYGANVSDIFYSIEDARDVILMQVQPSRIIVIDTGTGRFTNMSARKSLIDLLGICDEENQIEVFYTDIVIKSEVEYTSEVEDKNIKWHKYRSTADVLANILYNKKNENYVLDNPKEDILETDIVLKTRGRKVEDIQGFNSGVPLIGVNDIVLNMLSNSDKSIPLKGYDIKV